MERGTWQLRGVLLLAFLVACEEHGKSPQVQRCSSDWASVITFCEGPCVEHSLLRTDPSCWRRDDLDNAITCEDNRFANVDGHRGCCVFDGQVVEFVECNPGLPPDAAFFPDADETPGLR